eukprot:CAMPEP_0177611088 /NCGR_PEP_ID=MMETSP0419_2-20121207/20249_1 /TAXON_ID=582737 /ORGANISM="Tetraselmis sp., Strain GSL018" /LENGTH=109 /DNA_ID=CAMNT_0019106683 /DNA_START=243 /DNA_END=569 /DNA_ORIENTATION=+
MARMPTEFFLGGAENRPPYFVGKSFWEDVVLDENGDPLGTVVMENLGGCNEKVSVFKAEEFYALWIGGTLQSVTWAPAGAGPRTDEPVFGYVRAMAAAAAACWALGPSR